MAAIQIQFVNIDVKRSVMRGIERRYYQTFDRLGHIIARAHLKFQDTNGPKGGVDKQCTLQVRFSQHGFAVVKSSGDSFAQAAHNAFEKMRRVVAKRLGKKRNRSKDMLRPRIEITEAV